MTYLRKDFLDMQSLSKEEIEYCLTFCDRYIHNVSVVEPILKDKTVVLLFYENSTRTRVSFELAAKRLGAHVVYLGQEGTSAAKGELILDMAQNIEAMDLDILVCRHFASGVPQMLAKHLSASVINAGDGVHEHPTQALLDIKTILKHKSSVSGLKVAIVGDVAHSRVAHSHAFALKKLGAHVTWVGPATLLPFEADALGVEVCHDLKEGVQKADVVMMLRIQKERLGSTPFSSLEEYSTFYGLTKHNRQYLKNEALIMHPGPINKGVELDPETAEGPSSLILEQVSTGVAVRMGLLHLLSDVRGKIS